MAAHPRSGSGLLRARPWPIALLALLATGAFGAGEPPDGEAPRDAGDFQKPIQLSGGTDARPIEPLTPVYPLASRRRGEEGWVLLSYVIREDGAVADPVVEDSSGVTAMERSALEAIRQARYSPATWNGKPVEQCAAKMLVSFTISNLGLGARSSFKKAFKEASAAMEAGNLEQARAAATALAGRQGLNHYESARLWLLRADIATRQGDSAEALRGYRQAMRLEGRFLEPRLHRPIERQIFRLEVEQKQWGRALATYKSLKTRDPFAPDPDLEKVAAQIRDARDGTDPLGFEGVVGYRSGCEEGRANWQHELLRRKFALEVIEGTVEDFELRCDWRRIQSPVDPDKVWEVPASWGWCQLFVFGEPGARVKLVEYQSEVPAAEAAPVAASGP